ncbi:MAG: GxxExxY protein [Prosthecobacter sp.]
MQMTVCSESDFYRIDKVVTGLAFEIHNELGRFLGEEIYKRELAYRLTQLGHQTNREVRFTLSHEAYRKDYVADLIVDGSVVVEAKTADKTVPAHHAQGVNYLHLAGTQHGTLLNFRPRRVDHAFLSTKLDGQMRKRMTFTRDKWKHMTAACAHLHNLLSDWGGFLETAAYREALFHLLGIQEQPVTLFAGHREIGTHKFHLLDPQTAVVITAVTKDHRLMQRHLIRLFAPTHLRAMQWVNFNHHTVEFTTLSHSS